MLFRSYLVDEDTGEICLMEVAARGGGVFISSHLIPLGCGIDVNELLIKTAMGQAISFDPNDINEKASGYVCFYLPEGKIRSVQGIDLVNSLPGVHNAYLDNLVVGRQSAKMMDKTMRFGPILLAGNNRQSLQETIQKLPETLTVEVETQEGIRGIIW